MTGHLERGLADAKAARHAPLTQAQRLGAVLLAYFLAGKVGLALAAVHPSASAVWPPTGITLAVVILWGPRMWPAILAGAFLVNVTTTGDAPSSTGIALGNTLEALVGGWLVGRFAKGRRFPHEPATFFRFCGLVLLATTLSATIGVTSLGLRGLAPWSSFAPIWMTWWLGDVTGAILVAPLLVLWASPLPDGTWSRARRAEAGVLLAATLVVGIGLFKPDLYGIARDYRPVSYLALPLVAWAAFRFTPRETASIGALLSALAVWGTMRGAGPFASAPLTESLLLVQTFVAVVVAGGIPLAAAVDISRRSQQALEEANATLEARVQARTRNLQDAQRIAHLGSWEWQLPENTLEWSDEVYRIFGLDPGEFRATYDAFLDRVLPEDRDAVRLAVEHAVSTGEPYTIEHRVARPSGEIRHVYEQGVLTFDQAGRPVRMVGTVLDVTERKRAEGRFRALVEFAPDALILVDGQGRIVLVNAQVERIFGWPRDQLVGQTLEVLVPERFRKVHFTHRAKYAENPLPRPMGAGLDLFALRKDGTEFPCEISLSPLTGKESTVGEFLVTAAIRDITERKRTEDKLIQSLHEKEGLLKEIHHRVKNNLQVISSLLTLQAQHATADESRILFRESRNRVKSMALVHEKLYGSADFAKVDAGSYLADLLFDIQSAYGEAGGNVRLAHDVARDLSLDPETAINVGLITNELVANVFKHAFPDGRAGNVHVSLQQGSAGERILVVGDDGVGFPEALDFRATSTLGLQLVTALTRQLGGTISLDRSAGTAFRIVFPRRDRHGT